MYIDYLYRTTEYALEPLGNNLYPLAQECYEALAKMKGAEEQAIA